MGKKIYINIYFSFLLIAMLLISSELVSQNTKKVQFTGAARSVMNDNEIKINGEEDTVTAKKTMGGYALIDLGVNIQPNKNTEILGMVRIKNRFGGFYGAGVNFDVRQLYVKGIIADVIKYQLGDINYKLTPFTFYNHDEDATVNLPEVFKLQRDIVNYESFYQQNTWRQQGAALDFSLEFAKIIKEIKFNGFINRILPSDFNSNPDRFFAGGNIGILQSKNLTFGFNYVSLFDILGTATNKNLYRNKVGSISLNYKIETTQIDFLINGESGMSEAFRTDDSLDPKLNDYFLRADIGMYLKPFRTKLTLGYSEIGPDFRSAGAQSKRVNYSKIPSIYSQYTNQQVFRSIGLFDMLTDDVLYNRSISDELMPFNPIYNNVLPYGIATFNRRGFYSKLNIEDKKKRISLDISANLLNEIRGQGTLNLKQYAMVQTNLDINVHDFFKFKKKMILNGSYSFQQTTREGNFEFEKVNLSSLQWNSGIQIEFVSNLDLLAGYQTLVANGNEQMAERNVYSVVSDFNPFDVSLNESMVAAGLRYRFSEQIYLSGLYQNYDLKNNLNENLSYKLKQFLIVYSMKF